MTDFDIIVGDEEYFQPVAHVGIVVYCPGHGVDQVPSRTLVFVNQ
jgi:hypothetical protein